MSITKHNWTKDEIIAIYNKPMMDLLYQAATIHREHHDPNVVQVSTLLSIKTGGCPEDCAYCPQAARYHTKIEGNDLMTVAQVKEQALQAKSGGSSRVCMGAAWRNVKDGEDFDQVLEMVRTINKLDMEVCCTLGMITENQAQRLAEAGLYAYNHNLDTSEEYYKEVISTRGFEDRLQTIENVRKTNVTVCSGGIIGMGESIEDRAAREAKEYTEKVCPTPFVNDGRTDSTVFDKKTHTYIYYMTLRNKADNVILIKQNHKKLYDVQKQSLDNNPGLQKYKEAHFSFRFIYHSAKNPKEVLLDDTFKY